MMVGWLLFLVVSCSVVVAVPLPGSPQLEWSRDEIGVIIHYNLATAAGTQGCSAGPPPRSSLFQPKSFNATQWVDVINSIGAKYAVYVAKHGCGFTTWPTTAKLPDGSPYHYSVGQPGNSDTDIVKEFGAACAKGGVRLGFYYSVVSNSYLNVRNGKVNPDPRPPQVKVTQAQYESIVMHELTELWTQNGPLLEVWFDGGYQQDLKANLTALITKLQPGTVAFNGYGVSPNPLRWIGTEAGHAYPDTWSTGTSKAGDPTSTTWCPAESDTTLQNDDQWFYNPVVGLRSLKVLQSVYHNTVGRNTNLLLDIAPQPDGLVPDNAVARYKEFGDWIRTCYGSSVNSTHANSNDVVVYVPNGKKVDRCVIEEDQSKGQLVRSWSVEGLEGTKWSTLGTGQSIGNKRILLFTSAGYVALRFKATKTLGDATANIMRFSVHAC